MRTNPSDKYFFSCKKHHCNESVIIAFDIKDKPIITNIVCTVECLLDIGKTRPVCFFCLFVPITQSHINISMF